MPTFSKQSRRRLETCCIELQNLFNEVIRYYDCTVIYGHRGKAKQNELYRKGFSKLQWPDSLHNASPSKAVDVCPYPIDWNDRERFVLFGGYVRGVAATMGYRIRWGYDWDSDFDLRDQTFMDGAHFEYRGRLE